MSIIGINEFNKTLGLGNAFPNPSNKMVNFPIYADGSWDIDLTLFDISGKLVKSVFSGTITGNYTIQKVNYTTLIRIP